MSTKNSPYTWAERHLKFNILDFVNRVLGRVEDSNGNIMKIRQAINREMSLTCSSIGKSEHSFVVAPLPRWVAEKMIKVIFHPSFNQEVDLTHVSDWKIRDDGSGFVPDETLPAGPRGEGNAPPAE